jgi:hypothetical protein
VPVGAAASASGRARSACPARSIRRVCPGCSDRAATPFRAQRCVVRSDRRRLRWPATRCRCRHRSRCRSCGHWLPTGLPIRSARATTQRSRRCLQFLQDHAAFCRRGHAGTVQEATGGYVGAVFVYTPETRHPPQPRPSPVSCGEPVGRSPPPKPRPRLRPGAMEILVGSRGRA